MNNHNMNHNKYTQQHYLGLPYLELRYYAEDFDLEDDEYWIKQPDGSLLHVSKPEEPPTDNDYEHDEF